MPNKTDGDPTKKGGAYAPKGKKHPAGTKQPVSRGRSRITSPIKTTRHGASGSIALARAFKKLALDIKKVKEAA
jgi:hypothetical protein